MKKPVRFWTRTLQALGLRWVERKPVRKRSRRSLNTIEGLEERVVLSGESIAMGSSGADVFLIQREFDGNNWFITTKDESGSYLAWVQIPTATEYTAVPADYLLEIHGNGGNDRLIFDFANGMPMDSYVGVEFDAGTGSSSVEMSGGVLPALASDNPNGLSLQAHGGSIAIDQSIALRRVELSDGGSLITEGRTAVSIEELHIAAGSDSTAINQIEVGSGWVQVGAGGDSGAFELGAGAQFRKTGEGTLTIAAPQTLDSGAHATFIAEEGLTNFDFGTSLNNRQMELVVSDRVNLRASQSLASLTINSGGAVTVTSGTAKTIVTEALSIATGSGVRTDGRDQYAGTLDLTTNTLVVISEDAVPVETLTDYVVASVGTDGENGGLISSAVAAESQYLSRLGIIALGVEDTEYACETYLDNQTLLWADNTTDAHVFVARYTYLADVDLDFDVDGEDSSYITGNFNTPVPVGQSGDLDYTGMVDNDDLSQFTSGSAGATHFDAPIIEALPVQLVSVGETLAVTCRALDADILPGALACSLGALPSGFIGTPPTVEPDTGDLRWTPTSAQIGTWNFSLQVSDGTVASSQQVTISVLPVDCQIAGPASVVQGAAYVLQLEGGANFQQWEIDWGDGSDPDNDGSAGEVVIGVQQAVHSYSAGGVERTISASAYDSYAQVTRYSNSFEVTVAVSSPPVLTADTISSSEVTLHWNSGSFAANDYTIEISTNGEYFDAYSTSDEESTNSMLIEGLAPNQAYWLRIIAYGSEGGSAVSNVVQVVTSEIPPPTDLHAVSFESSVLQLGWAHSGNLCNGFQLELLLDSHFIVLQSLRAEEGSSTLPSSTSILGLKPGTSYTFRLRAFNDLGFSAPTELTVTTPVELESPGNVVATPLSASQVLLSWSDIAGEAGYAIEHSQDAMTWTLLVTTLGVDSTSYTVNNLSEGAARYYRIVGLGAVNSDPSQAVLASTLPLAPTQVSITRLLPHEASLTWHNASAVATTVTIEQFLGGTWTAIATTSVSRSTGAFTVSGDFSTSEINRLRLRSHVRGLDSAPSSEVAQTGVAPTAVQNLSLEALSSSEIKLTWQDTDSETGYRVQRSSDGITWINTGPILAAGVTTYTDLLLSEATRYFYRVIAQNAAGDALASLAAAQDTAPLAPNHLAVSLITEHQVTLQWQNRSARNTVVSIEQLVGTTWKQIGRAPDNATSVTATGDFPEGSVKNFRLRASANGAVSEPSTPIAISSTAPLPVTHLTATAVSDSQITVNWQAGSENSYAYSVELQYPDGAWICMDYVFAPRWSSVNGDLAEGTEYAIRVRALNHDQVPSGYSSIQTFVTSLIAPKALAVTAISSSQVTLAWEYPTDLTDRTLQIEQLVGSTWTTVATGLDCSESSATINGSFPNPTTVNYPFRVKAVQIEGTATGTSAVVGSLAATSISSEGAPAFNTVALKDGFSASGSGTFQPSTSGTFNSHPTPATNHVSDIWTDEYQYSNPRTVDTTRDVYVEQTSAAGNWTYHEQGTITIFIHLSFAGTCGTSEDGHWTINYDFYSSGNASGSSYTYYSNEEYEVEGGQRWMGPYGIESVNWNNYGYRTTDIDSAVHRNSQNGSDQYFVTGNSPYYQAWEGGSVAGTTTLFTIGGDFYDFSLQGGTVTNYSITDTFVFAAGGYSQLISGNSTSGTLVTSSTSTKGNSSTVNFSADSSGNWHHSGSASGGLLSSSTSFVLANGSYANSDGAGNSNSGFYSQTGSQLVTSNLNYAMSLGANDAWTVTSGGGSNSGISSESTFYNGTGTYSQSSVYGSSSGTTTQNGSGGSQSNFSQSLIWSSGNQSWSISGSAGGQSYNTDFTLSNGSGNYLYGTTVDGGSGSTSSNGDVSSTTNSSWGATWDALHGEWDLTTGSSQSSSNSSDRSSYNGQGHFDNGSESGTSSEDGSLNTSSQSNVSSTYNPATDTWDYSSGSGNGNSNFDSHSSYHGGSSNLGEHYQFQNSDDSSGDTNWSSSLNLVSGTWIIDSGSGNVTGNSSSHNSSERTSFWGQLNQGTGSITTRTSVDSSFDYSKQLTWNVQTQNWNSEGSGDGNSTEQQETQYGGQGVWGNGAYPGVTGPESQSGNSSSTTRIDWSSTLDASNNWDTDDGATSHETGQTNARTSFSASGPAYDNFEGTQSYGGSTTNNFNYSVDSTWIKETNTWSSTGSAEGNDSETSYSSYDKSKSSDDSTLFLVLQAVVHRTQEYRGKASTSLSTQGQFALVNEDWDLQSGSGDATYHAEDSTSQSATTGTYQFSTSIGSFTTEYHEGAKSDSTADSNLSMEWVPATQEWLYTGGSASSRFSESGNVGKTQNGLFAHTVYLDAMDHSSWYATVGSLDYKDESTQSVSGETRSSWDSSTQQWQLDSGSGNTKSTATLDASSGEFGAGVVNGITGIVTLKSNEHYENTHSTDSKFQNGAWGTTGTSKIISRGDGQSTITGRTSQWISFDKFGDTEHVISMLAGLTTTLSSGSSYDIQSDGHLIDSVQPEWTTDQTHTVKKTSFDQSDTFDSTSVNVAGNGFSAKYTLDSAKGKYHEDFTFDDTLAGNNQTSKTTGESSFSSETSFSYHEVIRPGGRQFDQITNDGTLKLKADFSYHTKTNDQGEIVKTGGGEAQRVFDHTTARKTTTLKNEVTSLHDEDTDLEDRTSFTSRTSSNDHAVDTATTTWVVRNGTPIDTQTVLTTKGDSTWLATYAGRTSFDYSKRDELQLLVKSSSQYSGYESGSYNFNNKITETWSEQRVPSWTASGSGSGQITGHLDYHSDLHSNSTELDGTFVAEGEQHQTNNWSFVLNVGFNQDGPNSTTATSSNDIHLDHAHDGYQHTTTANTPIQHQAGFDAHFTDVLLTRDIQHTRTRYQDLTYQEIDPLHHEDFAAPRSLDDSNLIDNTYLYQMRGTVSPTLVQRVGTGEATTAFEGPSRPGQWFPTTDDTDLTINTSGNALVRPLQAQSVDNSSFVWGAIKGVGKGLIAVVNPMTYVNLVVGLSHLIYHPIDTYQGTVNALADKMATKEGMGELLGNAAGGIAGGYGLGWLIGRVGTALSAAETEVAAEANSAANAAETGIAPSATSPTTPVGRSGSPLGSVEGNPSTTIGGRPYSGHAIDRMQGRGIPPSAVDNTIRTGAASPGKYPGTIVHYDPVNNISVVVDSATGRVVTVSQGRF